MLENHEKPGFTFFAFLPPYFGVSGPLVPGMRKIHFPVAARTNQWRPVAIFRYYQQKHINLEIIRKVVKLLRSDSKSGPK